MGNITLTNVSKSFGETQVIPPLDIQIREGEFVVLVGPSGCGKSTLLRLIAGLEEVSSGTIQMDDIDITDFPPAKRNLAMVFQSYALYPHMSVRKNIGFPLKMTGFPKQQIDERVSEAASVLGLNNLLARKPKQLSGGQRQRVAIGRAIVREPAAFLFDEPLSNLDAALRGSMRQEICALHKSLATTTVYVTHDQIEAMTMADKIVVLKNGVVQQIGTPIDLYRRPANEFVAGFIGSPRMNFVEGVVAGHLGASKIGMRPEDIRISLDSGDWSGTVCVSEYLGADSFIKVDTDDIGVLNVRASGEVVANDGDRVYLTPERTKIHRFSESGATIGADTVPQ